MIDVADKALLLLKKSPDPYSDIKRSSAYWIPLQWLYVRMIEKKGLVPIGDLQRETMLKYWNEVKEIKKHQAVKIMVWQALYTWDQLKNE